MRLVRHYDNRGKLEEGNVGSQVYQLVATSSAFCFKYHSENSTKGALAPRKRNDVLSTDEEPLSRLPQGCTDRPLGQSRAHRMMSQFTLTKS